MSLLIMMEINQTNAAVNCYRPSTLMAQPLLIHLFGHSKKVLYKPYVE